MDKETNLLDVCRSLWQGIVKVCEACQTLFVKMLRLTFSHWYIVFPFWIAVTSLLYYRGRPMHRKHQVEGIVLLNGPSVEHFSQAFNRIANSYPYSDTDNLWTLLGIAPEEAGKLTNFQCFEVIDMLHDGTPDFVDFHGSASRNDTLVFRMQDRVGIRFRLRHDINLLPKTEAALLRYFNSDPAMQHAYKIYLEDMQRQAKFNHDQVEKLDSLTSVFYFQQAAQGNQVAIDKNRMIVGDRRMRLFLGDVDKHMEFTRNFDERLSRATAPVVLEHHLYAYQSLYYHPLVMMLVNLLIGWLMGCLFGAMFKFRKEIIAFLRG